MSTSFHSPWRRELREFLKFRGTYFTFRWPERKIYLFDHFASVHRDLSLKEAIRAWLNRDPKSHPITVSRDLIAVRQFCLYRRRFEADGFVPTLVMPSSGLRSSFQARILSKQEIEKLLKGIDQLDEAPLRRTRLRVLFLVLYCTGLRIGEALRLRLVDVDLQNDCFQIGPSKGHIRSVPFGRDLGREIEHWLDCRRQAGFVSTPKTLLFEREDGRPESAWNGSMRLNILFRRCGFKPGRGTGRGGLRVHDLRHTFAVHRLERWYQAGVDPGPLLPWLSAYLGHVNLLGTQRYLQATPRTLASASRRFRRSLGFNPSKP